MRAVLAGWLAGIVMRRQPPWRFPDSRGETVEAVAAGPMQLRRAPFLFFFLSVSFVTAMKTKNDESDSCIFCVVHRRETRPRHRPR